MFASLTAELLELRGHALGRAAAAFAVVYDCCSCSCTCCCCGTIPC